MAGRDRIQNFTNLYSYLDSFLYFCPHWSVNYSFEKFGIDKKKGGDREIEFLVKGLLKISQSPSQANGKGAINDSAPTVSHVSHAYLNLTLAL